MSGTTRHAILVATLFAVFAGGDTQAQETTERYIPIGQSPGVSGVESVIGTIDAVDRAGQRMEVLLDGGTTSVALDDRTLFYLDRSASKLTNLVGSFDDCQVGRRVEVKTGADGVAEWVKVEHPG